MDQEEGECKLEWKCKSNWDQVMGVVVEQHKVFMHEQMAKVSDHECFHGMQNIWNNFISSDAKKPYSVNKLSADARKDIGNVPSGLPTQLYHQGEKLQDLAVSLKL